MVETTDLYQAILDGRFNRRTFPRILSKLHRTRQDLPGVDPSI